MDLADLSARLHESPWLALPLSLASVGLSALVSGRGYRRAVAALALDVPAILIPWLLPPSLGIYKFFLSLVALLPVIRAFDRARERRPISFAHRLWAATAPFETRAVARATPRIEGARFAKSAAFAALGAFSYWIVAYVAPGFGVPLRLVLRWGGGAILIYSIVESVVTLIIAGYRAFGFVLPPMHRDPILSRSLQEFWGERWNLTMRDWFYRHCFLPLARKRQKELGVLAAFGASTLIHIWLILVLSGVGPSLVMGSFFVAQGALTLIERRAGVLSWRPSLGRAWTIIVLLGTSPLFVEPMLGGLGV